MQSPYHVKMSSQPPLGQPVNPNPDDAQYVPQPFDAGGPKKAGKKMWIIIAGIAGVLLVLGGAYWLLSKQAAQDYRQDAAAYKQQIKEVRDNLDATLEEQDISLGDPETPPVLEEYGKQLQAVTAAAPQPPKVLGFLPVSGGVTKQEVDTLTAAANNYANSLRHVYSLVTFYTATADLFKPIKNLGSFTALDPNKIKALPGLWETFIVDFTALPVPPGQEALHAELIRQAEVLLAEFKELADGFDARTLQQNDDIITSLSEPTKEFNQTFQTGGFDSANEAADAAIKYYEELDKLLQ